LPDIFHRIELGRARRQEDRRDVLGNLELCCRMPSGAIKQQHGVCALGNMAADFVEMKLHGVGVGIGQSKRRARAARRTDRTEEIGILVALVGRLARPRAAAGPLPYEAVLLADPGFILEPDFDCLALLQAGQMGAQRACEVFLNSSMIRASCAGWRGRALTWLKPICFRSLPT